MRILITNDDGIDSPGIGALVDVLAGEHAVVVVAPSGNRSGVSHAITAHEAITMERRHDAAVLSYACSGTPADCVFLGSTELSSRPQLVISGINHGPNLADDVNYSGTVAGAVEASLLGIPALAVSLASDHEDPLGRRYWESAAQIVDRCIEQAFERLRDATHYWNLNVPNRPLERIVGIAVTRLGRKRICGRMVGQEHDGATQYYRAWESPFETDRDTLGTDIGAVHAGYASLTPLLLDRTAESGLETFSELTARSG
ncbi:MAG: 5'/3'-nucleotidase SurE [Candidatus Eremiobacteraeota bacterium]|nr:5'/3'-nucleotidase SurE [Candidatus Eremiobacteraeota bacterium]